MCGSVDGITAYFIGAYIANIRNIKISYKNIVDLYALCSLYTCAIVINFYLLTYIVHSGGFSSRR